MTREELTQIITRCPYRSKELIDVYSKGTLKGIHLATCNLNY